MKFKAIVILASLPLLMGAEVYRWVDPDGVINYTQQAPYGVKSERIRMRAGGPSETIPDPPPVAAEPESPKLSPKQQQMLDDLRDAEDAREAEIARIREANCRRSRDVLDKLSNRGRVRVEDDAGEQRMMPEEEREHRIKEAQEGIVTNCESAS